MNKRFKDAWKKYNLEHLINDVSTVYELKNKKPRNITVTSQALVSVIDYELYRQRKIADWNAKQKRLNRENADRE